MFAAHMETVVVRTNPLQVQISALRARQRIGQYGGARGPVMEDGIIVVLVGVSSSLISECVWVDTSVLRYLFVCCGVLLRSPL
jgi:hypothetical protein